MSTKQLWLFLVLVLFVGVVVSEIRTSGGDDFSEPAGTCGALLDETNRQMYEDTGTYLTTAEREDIRQRSPRCN